MSIHPVAVGAPQAFSSDIYARDLQFLRRTQASLTELREGLQDDRSDLLIVEALRAWHEGLNSALSENRRNIGSDRVDPSRIIEPFIDSLVETLRHPVSQELPSAERVVAPDGTVFVLSPVVHSHLLFLQEFRPALFERPIASPPPPLTEQERIQAIRERMLAERSASSRGDVSERFNDVFAILRSDREQALGLIAEETQASQRRMEVISARFAQMEAEERELQQEVVELTALLQNIDGALTQAEIGAVELKKAIAETREAIKKAKKRWVKDLGKAVLITAVCVAATWAMTTAISSASAGGSLAGSTAGAAPPFSASLAPKANGAMLNIKIGF